MSEQSSSRIRTENNYFISPSLFSDKVVKLVQENRADDHLLDSIILPGNHIYLNNKAFEFDSTTGEIFSDVGDMKERCRVVAYNEKENFTLVAPINKTTDEEVVFLSQ